MKAAFSAEAIGLTTSDEITAFVFAMTREFHQMNRPWVAEITGVSLKYRYARTFLRGKADYKGSNSKGTRGVWMWWTLESGHIYEAKYRTSWNRWEHRFLTVTDDGDIKDLTEEEVWEWLKKASASTS